MRFSLLVVIFASSFSWAADFCELRLGKMDEYGRATFGIYQNGSPLKESLHIFEALNQGNKFVEIGVCAKFVVPDGQCQITTRLVEDYKKNKDTFFTVKRDFAGSAKVLLGEFNLRYSAGKGLGDFFKGAFCRAPLESRPCEPSIEGDNFVFRRDGAIIASKTKREAFLFSHAMWDFDEYLAAGYCSAGWTQESCEMDGVSKDDFTLVRRGVTLGQGPVWRMNEMLNDLTKYQYCHANIPWNCSVEQTEPDADWHRFSVVAEGEKYPLHKPESAVIAFLELDKLVKKSVCVARVESKNCEIEIGEKDSTGVTRFNLKRETGELIERNTPARHLGFVATYLKSRGYCAMKPFVEECTVKFQNMNYEIHRQNEIIFKSDSELMLQIEQRELENSGICKK